MRNVSLGSSPSEAANFVEGIQAFVGSYSQIRTQESGTKPSDFVEVIRRYVFLPTPLKEAVLAIIRSQPEC